MSGKEGHAPEAPAYADEYNDEFSKSGKTLEATYSEQVVDQKLERRIGVYSGAAMTISLMIGSGIFSTPASIVALVGTPSMAMILWVVGAIVSLGGALAYIEMGLMYPRNGGTMRYLAHGFPKPKAMASFLFTWSMIFCIRPGAIAANGPVVAQYWIYSGTTTEALQVNNPWLADHIDIVERLIGAVLISFVTLLCAFSARWSLRLINALTVTKICVLLLIIISGLLALVGAINVDRTSNWGRGFDGTTFQLGAYSSAMNKVFWSYDGWSNLSYSTGEIINPARNLPISATAGISVVSMLYLLANISYFSVVPLDAAIASNEILAAEFTNTIFGKFWGQNVLPVFIGLSVFGSIAAQIYGVSRIIYAAGEVGYFPYGKVIGDMHPRFKTPVYALGINWVLTMLYLFAPPPGDVFNFLVDFVQYPTWVFYGLAVVGCVVLRRTRPNHPLRTFRAFLPIAIAFVVVCVGLSVFPFFPYNSSSDSYPTWLSPVLGLTTIILGLIPWYFRMVVWPKRKHYDPIAWIDEEELGTR